ncbi:MAG: ParA family protein [Bacteroidetes bacterium]|nr:ParA family protein [Bacteroidota bacterium]
MAIISVLNAKGGVGKTTLATNLVGAMLDRGLRVLLIDADPQRSSADWSYVRSVEHEKEALDIQERTTPSRLNGLGKAPPTHDHIIIDCAAKFDRMIMASVKISELVIVPVRPTALDMWAVRPVVNVIREQQEWMHKAFRGIRTLECAACFTQVGPNVDVSGPRDFLENQLNMQVLNTKIHMRMAYPLAIQEGKSVMEYEPGGEASKEILSLTQEILNIVC